MAGENNGPVYNQSVSTSQENTVTVRATQIIIEITVGCIITVPSALAYYFKKDNFCILVVACSKSEIAFSVTHISQPTNFPSGTPQAISSWSATF